MAEFTEQYNSQAGIVKEVRAACLMTSYVKRKLVRLSFALQTSKELFMLFYNFLLWSFAALIGLYLIVGWMSLDKPSQKRRVPVRVWYRSRRSSYTRSRK